MKSRARRKHPIGSVWNRLDGYVTDMGGRAAISSKPSVQDSTYAVRIGICFEASVLRHLRARRAEVYRLRTLTVVALYVQTRVVRELSLTFLTTRALLCTGWIPNAYHYIVVAVLG